MKNKLPFEPGHRPTGAQSKVPPARGSDVRSQLSQAVAFHRAGLLAEAEQIYRAILQVQPADFDSLHLLGVVHFQRGAHAAALDHIDAALRINPRSADAHNNCGNIHSDLRQFASACASYDRAIAINPNYAEALVGRANALHELGNFADALADCDRALRLRPDYAEASYNRGNALAAQKRHEDACAAYDRAIMLRPTYAEAFNNRGGVRHTLGQDEGALADFEQAIRLKPDYAQAFNNRGLTLSALKRFEDALASFDQAIAMAPTAEALNNRGTALQDLRQWEQAIASFDQALALDPNYVDAYFNRATTWQSLNRLTEAAADYDAAYARNPDLRQLRGARLHARMHLCRWDDFDRTCADLVSAIADGTCAAHPFALLPMGSTPAQQRACAEIYVADTCPPAANPLWPGERHADGRIRVAYLSADLHDHATAHLMAGLFEHHDRSRFETSALSFGPAQDSDMRRRLMRAFDRFIDVRAQSDQAVAELVRALEIDIAVDLKGFTQDARPNIFARRPAPIQVSYLGYPGTLGTRSIDYLIADRFVIPAEREDAYAENIVCLPDSYQVNDARRSVSASVPARASAGLPDTGLVFCCFNNVYKITPDVFDIWMRLLQGVDGSVLWLMAGHPAATDNLRREAQRRGVAPERLIFADRTRPDDHLARHRLADLFLDTYYCNAHTTASDALWAGLPLLTCSGETFASRVAGSLLRAVGLPELITGSLPDYEALAFTLARDPEMLAALKQKLVANRAACSLFDTARTTRQVEAAYATMWERHRRGEAPTGFAVGNG